MKSQAIRLGFVSVITVTMLSVTVGFARTHKAPKDDSATDYEKTIQKHIADAESLTEGSGLADITVEATEPGAGPNVPGTAIIPKSFVPWWQSQVGQALSPSFKPQRHTLPDLYNSALVHSAQIKAFSDIPLIRETAIQEANGIFDLRGFIEAKYDDTKEPVGSLLVSAINKLFLQEQGIVEAGVRQKTESGADISLSQRTQTTRSNSEFLAPNPQVLSTLAFTVVQPLLRNGGVQYNRSVLRIAQLDTQIAEDEFLRQAQSHLMEITRAYWALYLARGTYLQQKQLVTDTADIVARIRSRAAIDAVSNQLVRAESALASRKSDMIRSELAIRNAEDRLRALLDDPNLLVGSPTEILPDSEPIVTKVDTGTRATAVAALQNRPEISQGFKRLKATAIRQEVAKSDLLPQLNFIFEGRMKGLAQNHGYGPAIDSEVDQPSYLVGLSFEIPFANNQAKARDVRRDIESRQLTQQLNTTIETILLEVKVSVRALHTAYKEINAKYIALEAAQLDLKTLRERWGIFAEGAPVGFGDSGGSFLEFLLNAQSRVSQAQSELLASTVDYNVAITNLERAKGTLLKYEEIGIERTVDQNGLPVLQLRRHSVPKPATPVARVPVAKSPLLASVKQARVQSGRVQMPRTGFTAGRPLPVAHAAPSTEPVSSPAPTASAATAAPAAPSVAQGPAQAPQSFALPGNEPAPAREVIVEAPSKPAVTPQKQAAAPKKAVKKDDGGLIGSSRGAPLTGRLAQDEAE